MDLTDILLTADLLPSVGGAITPRPPGTVVAAGNMSEMLPRSSPVSSDGGYEVLCSYDYCEVPKDGRSNFPVIANDPGKPPRYTRPKTPFQLLASYIDYPDSCPELARFPFAAALKTIKTVNPDFRFDNIDLVIYRPNLTSMFWAYQRWIDFAEFFQAMHFQLYHRTLFISYNDVKGHRDNWGTSPGASGLITAIRTGPPKKWVRVIKYDFGGLTCIVISETDLVYSLPRPILTTKKVSASPGPNVAARGNKTAAKKARKGKTTLQPGQITEAAASAIFGYPNLNHEPNWPVLRPSMYFGRDEYGIKPIMRHKLDLDQIWVHDIKVLERSDLLGEWEKDSKNQEVLCKMAGVLS
ncbi:geranylgeranyl pyrophosphate synthetase [Fusarium longipes]|uniref:Geranylgeranyl pyrophosphate synthetase n=1 Tax=Fusarium longipes TaxID=694270 RepID=A0A395TAY8_9HYPO|nr:geranylgeranyl pyrophosphate synthetase [Fusarium longipes]